jgi:predicted HicB family RNase H-like nuclease
LRTCATACYIARMAKISVFLDEDTHRAAKVVAMDDKQSLSQWVAGLVAKQLSKVKPRGKESVKR